MAKRIKKITVDIDFFYDNIANLEDNQKDFVKEHLDLKTMKIPADKLQELYDSFCEDGKEILKNEFSEVFDFKQSGPVVFDDTDVHGWTELAGSFDGEDLITVKFNSDDETLGTITFDHELIKVSIKPDGNGTFVITAEYV